jgi:hypothetical protein
METLAMILRYMEIFFIGIGILSAVTTVAFIVVIAIQELMLIKQDEKKDAELAQQKKRAQAALLREKEEDAQVAHLLASLNTPSSNERWVQDFKYNQYNHTLYPTQEFPVINDDTTYSRV